MVALPAFPSDHRIVMQFSCGAASAVAAKTVVNTYGLSHQVDIVNALLKEEHPDNRRFLTDCEAWLGRKITVIADEKYGASVRELWRRGRFIKGFKGAPCSKRLKRDLLDAWKGDDPRDVVVLGYTAEEADRLDDWIDANNGRHVLAPLIELGLSKADCLAMLERDGLVLPMMYRLGFHNANCIGCCKGGMGYWNKVRDNFPEDFEEVARIEEAIGPSAYILFHRSGPLKGKRFPLRELRPDQGNYPTEPSIECSGSCELVEQSAAWGELREEQLW